MPSIIDLAVHLGKQRRFGGWGAQGWTVLHHGQLCAMIWLAAGFPRDGLVYALMHDGHEAYLGDTPSPVKRALKQYGAGDALMRLEDEIQMQILEVLAVPPPDEETRRRVALVDLAALLIEAPLFGAPGTEAKIMAELEERYPDLAREGLLLVDKVCPELRLVIENRKKALA